jgi:hypothetical protein
MNGAILAMGLSTKEPSSRAACSTNFSTSLISQSCPGVMSTYQTGLIPSFRAVCLVNASPKGQVEPGGR